MKNNKRFFAFLLAFLLLIMFYFSDTIHFISWKYNLNLYRILFFMKEKPFLENDDFARGVSIFTYSFSKLTIIILIVMIIIMVWEHTKKNLTKLKTAIYLFLFIIALVMTIIIFQYDRLIDFYNSPSIDIPWNYRNILWP